VEKKSDFEFPDDHREALKQAIALVTRLLIIGWRGTEQHFLDLWRQNFPKDLKRVLVVAGDWEQANAVKQQVQAYMQGDYLVSKQSGFSRFVTSPDLDWLLNY
jgi:hypothetical protein